MTPDEVQYETQVSLEIEKARLKCLEKKCLQRYNPEYSHEVAVQFKTLPQKEITWDDKQNDEHHNRRTALVRFMNAGTKVILKYRMLKRLAKIREFIGQSRTKQEVKKKV